ncbi:MAG: hypothetical protein U0359_14885 [Byssovorax sp.]
MTKRSCSRSCPRSSAAIGPIALSAALLAGCSSSPPVEPPASDPCKPAGVAPEVIVGRGEFDYIPMNEGDVIQIVVPIQGGHVVWLALRQTGLLGTDSTSTAKGRIDALDLDIPPSPVSYSFTPDKDGYCELFGLPLTLPGDRPVSDMFGQKMEVTIEVIDREGTTGKGQKLVTLSDNSE